MLIDGYALAYRHYFAQQRGRPLTTSGGEPTSAVYGFARMLLDILEKERPRYLAVAFDAGLSGRDQIYAGYKATRDEMPSDLETQIARIEQLTRAFNIPVLTLPGYEADDIIGTISAQAEAQDLDVRIVSGDRDLLQLLSDRVSVRLFIPQARVPDVIWDLARFRADYELEPHQLIDLKALEGDTSDNIPGVKGIGEKTAKALLKQFPSLEAIYAGIDQIPATTQKKLLAGREDAFLSKQLATIRRDAPIALDLQACLAHDFDRQAVEALFRELEFGSLFAQLNRIQSHSEANAAASSGQLALFPAEAEAGHAPAEQPAAFPFQVVRTADELSALARTLIDAQAIAFDVETTDTDPMRAKLVGIALCCDGATGYYIPVGHIGMLGQPDGEQPPLDAVIAALRPALTDPAIPKYAHNANFDLLVMQQHGIDVRPIAFDTLIAEWLRDPLSNQLKLKRLAAVELNVHMTEIQELIGSGKTQITMDQVPIERAAPYAAADAVATYRLVAPLRARLLPADAGARVDPLWGVVMPPPLHVFETIEMPLVPVLVQMERAGVLLDVPYLHDYSRLLADQLRALQLEIYNLAGGYGPFNINSPKQLNDVLFGKLGLRAEGVRKTTHGFSTAADVLDDLRGQHPIIDKILEYRELTKLQGTYVEALPRLIHPQTGRVHTSFNQTGASTGRLSSSNPNLQNIPIRTDAGRAVRRAFIAPPGWQLISVDYSQVELRIMAHVAQEPTLLQAFRDGQDIHAATASVIYGVPLDQVTRTQRNFAKRVNFGLLYGMGAYRLARDSDLTLAEAEAFIKTYFKRLPGVKNYIDRAKQIAREQKYLCTLFGRRRQFPGLENSSHNIRAAAEREAINMPIQGTAADIIKRAMIDLQTELARSGLAARLLLQVHDELVLEAPSDQVEAVARLTVSVMERAADLRAALRCNAAAGPNWLDMTPIDI
jgi:DNA polymerase-1